MKTDLIEMADAINATPLDEIPADLVDDVVAAVLGSDDEIPVARFGSAI